MREQDYLAGEVGFSGHYSCSHTGITLPHPENQKLPPRVVILEPYSYWYQELNTRYGNLVRQQGGVVIGADIYGEMPRLKLGFLVLENVVNDTGSRKDFAALSVNLSQIMIPQGIVLLTNSLKFNDHPHLLSEFSKYFDVLLDEYQHKSSEENNPRREIIEAIKRLFPGDSHLEAGLTQHLNRFRETWLVFRRKNPTFDQTSQP